MSTKFLKLKKELLRRTSSSRKNVRMGNSLSSSSSRFRLQVSLYPGKRQLLFARKTIENVNQAVEQRDIELQAKIELEHSGSFPPVSTTKSNPVRQYILQQIIQLLPSMSQIRSNSSVALSAIQLNSKSLNPLDSIHPSIINRIKREADEYIGCPAKCVRIWEALAKNDIAGSHMTENVIEVIFKEFQNDLSSLTKVNSVKDFMRVFDQDKDGCLNSDEQIQIFLFIKERLEVVANNCLQIQAYVKFEVLMKEVRILEGYIVKWQKLLRDKVHSNQIGQYRREGESKVDEFCDRFDWQFSQLQKTMLKRRQHFEKQIFYESQALEQRLANPAEYVKIKPKNRLKELQFQQKLVSLEERVYEALDFRKELNELEITEKDRVDKLMREHADQQTQNLRVKHHKQRMELQQKLQEMQNKLIIKMKREFEVLKKKNTLHEIEIRRLQCLEIKWADHKGLFEPQLKRTKKLQRKRNQVLYQYKKTMKGGAMIDDETINEEQKPSTNKFSAQSILNNTTKFKLTNSSESDIPVNSKPLKIQSNFGRKINKYIAPKTSDKAYSLCKLYDTHLKQQQQKPVVSQQLLQQQKHRKQTFMMSKLLH